jgi:hypothetical protein
LALIIGPAMIVRLFLGVDESGEETPLGRFLGIALLALGWACWPHRQRIDCDAPALHGMLIYNLLILLYLTYLGTVGHLGSERTDRPTDRPRRGRLGIFVKGVLKVDGKAAATLKIPHTIPLLLPVNETIDVGIGTRSPVGNYAMPFRFNGKIPKLPVKLGPKKLSEADYRKVRLALANAKD